MTSVFDIDRATRVDDHILDLRANGVNTIAVGVRCTSASGDSEVNKTRADW